MASTFIKLPKQFSSSDIIDDSVIALDKTWSSSKINDEIDIIGDNYVRSTRFAIIGSGTNGTVTIPGTQTIILDDFGGTTDAILSNEDSGKPDYTVVLDSGGVQVATTFDSSGNYSFTGTPVSYPVCIIYRVREKFRDYDDTDPSVLGIPTIEGLIRSVNGYIGTVNLGIDDLTDVDTTTTTPNINDTLIWDGSEWVPAAIPSAPVISVNGQTGVVVLDTDDVAEGATNLYYTEARVSANTDVVANTAKVSADGSIDTHSDVDTTTNAPNPNEVLSWDGSEWVPAAIPSAPVTSVNGETGIVVLDSDDISEGTTNLYYTETRFDSSFSGKDTDNLSEGATNLYYTEARVSANPSVVANTAKVSADGSIDTHSDVDTTSTAPNPNEVLTWDGSNWVPAINPVAPVDSVNGQTGVVVLDTDDISEGATNLYYTETRFDTSFSGKDTDDLSEGVTNLYYTEARVSANPSVVANTAKVSADGSIDTHSDVDTTSTAPNPNEVLTWDGSNWVPAINPVAPVDSVNGQTGVVVLDSDDILEGSTNLYYTETRFDTSFSGKDTDDLTEGATNLYFTDARVTSSPAVVLNTAKVSADGSIDTHSDVDTTTTPPNLNEVLSWDGSDWVPAAIPSAPVDSVNGQTGVVVLDTDDVSEGATNLYYTETRFDTSFSGKDTDDLSEGTTNLYFTDARVSSSPAVVLNTAKVSADGSVDTHSDVDTTTTPPNTNEVLSWNGSNWVPAALASAPVDSVNGQTGVVVLDSDDISEGTTNLYYTETRFNTSFSGKDTDDLSEGVTNLYFTDARVASSPSVVLNTAKVSADGSIDTHSDVDTTTTLPNPNEVLSWNGSNWVPAALTTAPVDSVNGQTGVVVLDSDDISEGTTNLYYTETRFNTSFSGKDTDDLSEGTTNLYFTDTRVSTSPAVVANTAKVSADGSIDTHSDVDTTTTTPNPNEVLSWNGSNWVPAALASAPVDSVNGQTGVVVLDTDDVSEGSSNFYYTEARFDTSFSGKSTTDLSEGTNLYYTEARVSANTDVAANTAHRNITSGNPHGTTYAQISAVDPGTDVTAAELENLSDGTNADSLHGHKIVSFAQYSNTDTTTNLNGSVNVNFIIEVPLTGTSEFTDPDFTVVGNGIQCNFDGQVKVRSQVHMFSNSGRASCQGRFKINGTTLAGPVSSTGYIRNGSGHNESSISSSCYITVSDGDIITYNTRREASTGVVTMSNSGTSNIIIERWIRNA